MISKSLTLNGTVREIVDGKILSDNRVGIDIDEVKRYNIKIPFLGIFSDISDKGVFSELEDCLINKLIELYKFDNRYKNATFENFKYQSDDVNIQVQLDSFRKRFYNDGLYKSLLLCGKDSVGCGKTHLINALANEWFRTPRVKLDVNKYGDTCVEYCGANYKSIREEDLILRVLATYKKDPNENEFDVYKYLDKFDILAIDDIGKYAPTNLEFYRRVMFQIIDTRYNNGKGIVLSTNFGLTELTKFFGVAISDRLNEMTKEYQLEFKGKSNRAK